LTYTADNFQPAKF